MVVGFIQGAVMAANEITFFRLIAVQIVPGVSFYGTIEIEVN